MIQTAQEQAADITDLFVIGGGINGCGIARDAAGRGLSVRLAEMNDLASATSSASTKLFHGGLRYLEYFEFRLVREALIERETLLSAMPHISWPMRFILPYHKGMRFDSQSRMSKWLAFFLPWLKGARPAWLLRLGLFLYDSMGGRKHLPATSHLDLKQCPEGRVLKPEFQNAFEYSDCWVDDARLVSLNARSAADLGARVHTRTKVISVKVQDGIWILKTKNTENGRERTYRSRALVNAGGPWVTEIIEGPMASASTGHIRLVRGSHIVTRQLFDHDKCYFMQGKDGRIAFAIPYEDDFSLIGTTDVDHAASDVPPECTPDEESYLIDFANGFLKSPITSQDVVWRYSGVRPLYDDGDGQAAAASRDYTVKTDHHQGAPVVHVFGGKITTYRKLAETVLSALQPDFTKMSAAWTAGAPLPGGDFPVEGRAALSRQIAQRYPFLPQNMVARLVRSYGTDVFDMLSSASGWQELGQDFGHGLTETEVRWLMVREFADNAQDVLWRRSKLGLRFSAQQADGLDLWMRAEREKPAVAESAG